MGGTQNECAVIMNQFINEGSRQLKEFAENFDQHGPELLFHLPPEDVSEEDSTAANIIRIEYMNKGFCF